MKKVTSIALIALFAIGFTSCKKEWTCSCSTTVNGTTTTVEGKTGKLSKKDAEAGCNKESSAGGITVKCAIK